eukprot:2752388-Amphidinium_carterae.1
MQRAPPIFQAPSNAAAAAKAKQEPTGSTECIEKGKTRTTQLNCLLKEMPPHRRGTSSSNGTIVDTVFESRVSKMVQLRELAVRSWSYSLDVMQQ